MADEVESDPTPAPDSRPSPVEGRLASNRRRLVPAWGRRGWAAAAVLVLSAATVSGLTWLHHTATDTADHVHIAWNFRSPQCTGGKVTGALGDGKRTIHAVPGITCTLLVYVLNRSGRTVHLGDVVTPFGGPHTGLILEATSIDGHYDLNRDLPAHQRTVFRVEVAWNPRGCNFGGSTTVFGYPTVAVHTLGRTFNRSAPARNALRIHQDVRSPGCQDHSH